MNAESDAILPFAICEQLGLRVGYERSFKIRSGKLLANRYLIGIQTNELSRDQAQQVAKRLRLPELAVDTFWPYFEFANLLLIGFEDSEPGSLYKLYLEFEDHVLSEQEDVGSESPSGARLLHRGIKWNTRLGAEVRVSDYIWHPGMSAEMIRQRIVEMVESTPIKSDVLRIVDHVLSVAHASELRFVVVQEGNRQSFDLNCYATGLTVGDVYGACRSLMQRLSALDGADQLQTLVQDATFGHLAAGVDGAGECFATLYYEPTN